MDLHQLSKVDAVLADAPVNMTLRETVGRCLWRLVRRVRCFFGSHDYRVTQTMSNGAVRVACPHCGGMWGKSDDLKINVSWCAEMHRAYERWGQPIVYQPWEGRENQNPPLPNTKLSGR